MAAPLSRESGSADVVRAGIDPYDRDAERTAVQLLTRLSRRSAPDPGRAVQRVVTFGTVRLTSVADVRRSLADWADWTVLQCNKRRVEFGVAVGHLLAGSDVEAADAEALSYAVLVAADQVPVAARLPDEEVEEEVPADVPVAAAAAVRAEAPRMADDTRLDVPDLTERTSYVAVGDSSVKGRARPDPRTIFIGVPSIDDVHQGSIGTCYFLSHLMLLAHTDVSHVVDRLIRYDAASQTAVVSFWYQQALPPRSEEDAERPWAVEKIPVDLKLALTNGRLTGAKVRREVTATDYMEPSGEPDIVFYRTALWVPLLEKAYAIFAQRFGRFGYAGSGSTGSGYEVIDTGASTPHMLLRVIYGPALGARDEETLPWGDELDDLGRGRSAEVVSQLVSLETARRSGKKAFLTAALGSQKGKRDLFIHGQHVYAITSVELYTTEGLEARAATEVDPTRSQVVLRNPHRTRKSDKFASDAGPGELRMNLSQFFVNFGTLSWALVDG